MRVKCDWRWDKESKETESHGDGVASSWQRLEPAWHPAGEALGRGREWQMGPDGRG